MSKIKLLFIYKYCNMGGVASVIKQRYCRMKDHYDFECVFLEDAGIGSQEWARFGIRALILGKNFGPALKALLKKNEYQAITVIDTPEVMPTLHECHCGPTIYEVHTSYLNYIYAGRQAIQAAQAIFVPSNWSKNLLIERLNCEADKISVVPNYIDEGLFHYDPPERKPSHPIVLWVGKMDNNKNWRDALAVFDLVSQRLPKLHLRFITGGTYSMPTQLEFIAELIRRHLMDKVELIHQAPYTKMPRLYSEAALSGGILLSTSLSESFSMIVQEAWNCRLPVVAANVGPFGEVIQDGVNGLLFAPRDVQSAARNIESLIQKGGKRAALIRNAGKTMKRLRQQNDTSIYIDALERFRPVSV